MACKRFLMVAAAISLFWVRPVYASENAHLTLLPQSKLWLKGNSTLHPYASTATKMNVSVDIEKESGPQDMGKMLSQGKAKNFVLTIPVFGLKSGEKGLDKNMYSSLKEKQFPEIKFGLEKYDFLASTSTSGGFKVNAAGKLAIAGVEKTVELSADAAVTTNTVEIRGNYNLLMSDYGIKPPTMFLGALKVRDAVVVEYDLILGLNGEGK